MWILLYTSKGIRDVTIANTSSTHIDLYDIPHIFYPRIIHTHCLRTLTGHNTHTRTHTHTHIYIYIYIYIYLTVICENWYWPYMCIYIYIYILESMGECDLWGDPYFTSSASHVLSRFIWMIYEMRCKWPHSSCFVGYFFLLWIVPNKHFPQTFHSSQSSATI